MEDQMMKKPGTKESNFHVTLSSSPSAVQAGKPFTLKIALHDKNGKPITDLQISHERILHVIIVSEDLEEFIHVHPEDFGWVMFARVPTNEFEIRPTLSKAGRYRVLADASRKIIGEVSNTAWLEVEGNKKTLFIQKDLSINRVFGEYEVSLQTKPDLPKSEEKLQLSYLISDVKTGNPVFDAEPYLGADMHLAIMPVDLSIMFHTHGVKWKPRDVPNVGISLPEIRANYIFPYPGLWKIYGQFQHKGKVVTTEFMVEVAQGANQMAQPQIHMDNHGQ